MKAVCYILTVYFLSLTGMPCADSIDHSPKDTAVSFSVSGTSGSHDHPDAGDNCSTLCGCQCCQIHVLIALPAALSKVESTPADYVDHIHPVTSTVVSPFLRPPIS